MFRQLLVPIDFSDPSDAALEYARMCGRAFGATLHLMHVLPNAFLRPVFAEPRVLEDAAHTQLRNRFTSDDPQRLHIVTVIERSDEPAEEILRYARLNGIDLIVMGTHGRSGMSHLLMGSVAEKVLRTSPCPVMTVRAVPEASRITSDAALRKRSRGCGTTRDEMALPRFAHELCEQAVALLREAGRRRADATLAIRRAAELRAQAAALRVEGRTRGSSQPEIASS